MISGYIRGQKDLSDMIAQVGILPFFTNGVPGWSVEEHIDPALWFTDQPGPWEWKGPLAAAKACAYGKFLRGRAAFISPEWFPDLANWRRDGYDWEGWDADGLAHYKDRLLMRYLEGHPYALAKNARRECGFTKGFDTVVTRMQMQTFVVTADFQYSVTKEGVPYGWGNAVIEPAERFLGDAWFALPEPREPAASFERMIAHLRAILPEADEAALRRELK